MTLRIKCPACQRHFKVGEELKGRTVECGACETQFVVDEETVVSQRERYFPGDIKKTGLDHYGRAPESGRGASPVGFATATYDQRATAADVIPATPQRMFAGALGVIIQLFFVVVLLFGSQENGMLSELAYQKRIILSAFVVFMGGSLILYGAFRRKLEAFLSIAVLGGLVMGLAIFLKSPEDPLAPGVGITRPGAGIGVLDPAPDKISEQEVMDTIGYGPVAKAITDFGQETVYALWVPTLKASFKYGIQRYLHRKTGTGERPSIYNRGAGGLIVIEGTRLGMSEFRRVVERFATIEEEYPNIRVFRITIDGEQLVPPSVELEVKLKDKDHGAFYIHNLEELDHIDIDRVREAAHRLADAEPKSQQPEILRRLVALLDEDPDPKFRATVSDAIMVWSKPGDGAEEAVARLAQDLLISGDLVPRSMVQFLMVRNSPEAPAILEALWAKEPNTWEPLLIDSGKDAEVTVAPYLRNENRGLQRSAITIIKRVGTRASIPALQEALENAGEDEEMKLIIRSAIQSLQAD